MFELVKKIFKKNKMLNRNQLTEHSVVLADKRVTRVPDGSNLIVDIKNHQIPFNELTNIILITNSLRANNIIDIVSQTPSNDHFTQTFETPNFSLKLEPLRFVCIQKTQFHNFQCGDIMKDLINADITGNTISLLGSIGINYECLLNIPQDIIFQKLFQQKIISPNNQVLTSGNFKFTYKINEDLLIHIQIFIRQNEWRMSFNADNLVNPNNTITTILKTDFYNIYFAPIYNQFVATNN